jgi:putative NADH-flavin reductase
MKLIIFGATGGTGRHVVEQALKRGHAVTAFARTPEKMGIEDPDLTMHPGDATDAEAVRAAVARQEAVISTLAPSRQSPADIMQIAAWNITRAMQAASVRRLIMTSGAGVRSEKDAADPLAAKVMLALLKLISGSVLEDSTKGVEIVKKTDLDWTVVRYPRLGNAPGTGHYQIGYERPGFAPLSRADAARALLDELENGVYVREMPIVSAGR